MEANPRLTSRGGCSIMCVTGLCRPYSTINNAFDKVVNSAALSCFGEKLRHVHDHGSLRNVPHFAFRFVYISAMSNAPLRTEKEADIDNHSPKGRSPPADTCGVD